MMRNKRLLRLLIISVSIVIAYISYILAFDVTDTNMTSKLSKHIDDESLRILEIHEVGTDEIKDLIVYFQTNESLGVSSLHKGLNDKYIINELVESDLELDAVGLLINRKYYLVLYGMSDKDVSALHILKGANKAKHSVNSKKIFVPAYGEMYDGMVQITYEEWYHVEPHQVHVQSTQGSSWKSILVLIRSVLLMLLTYIFTTKMSKNYNKRTLDEYNRLPTDGQGVKQFWHR